MKPMKQVLATLLLGVLAPIALAQHGGHGASAPSDGGYGNAGGDSSMRDFQRALMLQATDEQREAFSNCFEATARVRILANQIVGSGSGWRYDAAIFPGQKEQLQAALAQMGDAHHHFRHSLSKAQEKELGKSLGKLDRYDVELGSRIAQLDRELGTNKPDPKRLYKDARKIQEVAEKWRSEHRTIGKAMGIAG